MNDILQSGVIYHEERTVGKFEVLVVVVKTKLDIAVLGEFDQRCIIYFRAWDKIENDYNVKCCTTIGGDDSRAIREGIAMFDRITTRLQN